MDLPGEARPAWRWERPLAGGNQIRRYWQVRPDDVWGVGDAGAVVRFDGAQWTAWESGTARDLKDAWASGPRDVWAVGGMGTILRFDGVRWREITPVPTSWDLALISGTGPDNVWIMSEAVHVVVPPPPGSYHVVTRYLRQLLHFDGTVWTVRQFAVGDSDGYINVTALAVLGRGPYDVWGVGTHVLRFSELGGSIRAGGRPMPSRLNPERSYTSYVSGSELWAASAEVMSGVTGELVRCQGSDGSCVEMAAERNVAYHLLGARGRDDIWVKADHLLVWPSWSEILHWDGSVLQRLPGNAPLPADLKVPLPLYRPEDVLGKESLWMLAGASSEGLWAVSGRLLQRRGAEWIEAERPGQERIWAMWGERDRPVGGGGGGRRLSVAGGGLAQDGQRHGGGPGGPCWQRAR
jgi:hypothetical protein